jgi:hypothetical protein
MSPGSKTSEPPDRDLAERQKQGNTAEACRAHAIEHGGAAPPVCFTIDATGFFTVVLK